MTTPPLGICIIGAGKMGEVHAEGWHKLPQARVVAVMDVDEARATALAATYEAQPYTDYRVAIDQPTVDVVSVCVPTHLHPDISIFAAEHGKHVLCEKPIALTLAAADAMIEAARRHNVKLSVGLMRRHSPVLPQVRGWLRAGRLGRPVMYHGCWGVEIRPKRAMHDAQANGGPLIDMAVHYFDSWAYLFESRATQVYAQGLKLAQQRPELAHIREIAYDTATVTVHYESGDIGSYVVSWGLPPETEPVGLADQIFCPKGLVQIKTHWGKQEAQVMWAGQPPEPLPTSEESMYQRQIAHFAACVLEDKPPLVTGEIARESLRVALAALESLETGRVVALGV